MANAGVPVEVRQKFTGHASAEMNAHYAHHEIEMLRVSIGKLQNAKMLFRAIGPSIVQLFTTPLQDPRLDLYDAQGAKIATNDNWKDAQEVEITATGLALTDDRESAISISLAPGAYTAVVSGVGGTTGVGLVEAYNLP